VPYACSPKPTNNIVKNISSSNQSVHKNSTYPNIMACNDNRTTISTTEARSDIDNTRKAKEECECRSAENRIEKTFVC
jgi:hypothetical protein